MEKRMVHQNGQTVALLHSETVLIEDGQSALDLIATLDYYDNCHNIAINKEALAEDFFKLGTGLAGEVLQKVVNYRKKIAIIGDFSGYTSKPLRDFIYECNRGNAVFFVPDEQTALERLCAI